MATYATPTTTLIVSKPTNFHCLETRYKLVRYELPETLLRVAKKNRNAYVLLHNSLRDQLDCPYKIWKHDRLDGVEKRVIYALYPRYAVPTSILLSLFASEPLSAREISFEELDLYPLLNLLQVAYCHKGQAGRFIGEDACYMYAKKDGNTYLCLRIDIKSNSCPLSAEGEQEFQIVGLVRRMLRVTSFKRVSPSLMCFVRKRSNDRCSFVQVKQSDAGMYRQRREQFYEMCSYEGKFADLLSQDQQSLEMCIGKLLYDFIHDFSMELASYGIISCSKKRSFRKLEVEFAFDLITPEQAKARFPRDVLDPVFVLDHRLNRECPFQSYLDVLTHLVPDLHFKVVTDLSEVRKGVALLIQDYQKEDFEWNGALAGLLDTPADLYKKYSHVIWQSLNVNPNRSADRTANAYLDYSVPALNDKDFQMKADAALAQLYLKEMVQSRRRVRYRLPLLPVDHVFIRKKHDHETLLYVEKNVLYFLDLRDPAACAMRDELLMRLGVNWDAMYAVMRQKHLSGGTLGDAHELARYDVIIGPDLFVELKDLDERVLYDYDEIIRDHTSMDVALPIEEFKLLPHYDEVCLGQYLPSSTIRSRGLLDRNAQLSSKREVLSLKFYHQLEAFDAFLDEVQLCEPLLSFNRLTRGEYWEAIIRIFEFQPDKNGHYSRGQFKSYYQKRGWFSNDKARALPLYEGIWYDNTHCYVAGPDQSPHQRQLHAHLIRRFDVYQGEDHFDCFAALLATCMQCVDQRQRVVYPYVFYLIDLHVENTLRSLSIR